MKSFGVAAAAVAGALFATRAVAELQPIVTKVSPDSYHLPSKLAITILPKLVLNAFTSRDPTSSTRTVPNSLSRVLPTSRISAQTTQAQHQEANLNLSSILWPMKLAAVAMFLFSRSWA